MRVIVAGAVGQLGRQIVARLGASPDYQVVGYDREQWDITDAEGARDLLLSQRATWLINAAALTQVDWCETRAGEANAVNAEAVAHLAAICNEAGTILLQVSTDYVFDGRSPRPYREEDVPNPINAYGRSKWLGEQHARSARRHLIVRTAWLYGAGGSNFVDTVLGKAAAGESIRVVNDQWGSPSYAGDMAECIERLMRIEAQGIFHIANSGEATWCDLARRAIELAGVDVTVEAITTDAYPTPARRPLYSVLDCTRYVEATGHRPRVWTSALAAYLHDRGAS